MSDWKSERERVLCDAKCLVVKIGSAVLTDSQGLRADVLHSLAAQLAQIQRMGGGERKILVVSSAAVAAGRAVLAENGVKADTAGLAARQGAAAIGQGRLMRAWDDAFHCQNLPTAQVLLTQDDFRVRQRLLNARNTFTEILSWGAVPIVNENDTVSTEGLKFGDNDSLASLLVTLVGADLLINLTSSPGVFKKPPVEARQPLAQAACTRSYCPQGVLPSAAFPPSFCLAARRTLSFGPLQTRKWEHGCARASRPYPCASSGLPTRLRLWAGSLWTMAQHKLSPKEERAFFPEASWKWKALSTRET